MAAAYRETDDTDAGFSLRPGYSDLEYSAVEMARLIRPSWQIACHLGDIPAAGDWHGPDYAGESVIMMRGRDGAVSVFGRTAHRRRQSGAEAADG